MSRYGDYLKQYQPVVYKSFLNSLNHDKMPHAILLVGENGTPVKETAIYLAKSLLCDSPNPLACEECRTCLRVDHLSYTDFVMLDGAGDSIKKEDVQDLMNQFSKTPLESKGKLVYVINLVENLNDRTINSLLKFLEEPQENTYAILTTANEAKVLPTIISRCVKMRLIMVPRREIIRQVLDLGVALEDAEILSAFTSSPESIRIQSQDEDYINTKRLFEETLDILRPRNAAILGFEDLIMSNNIRKNGAKYFLDMLSLAFKDMVAIQNKQTPSLSQYAKILEPLASTLPHIALSLEEILRVRSELDLNIDITLLLEHVIIFLTNRENDDDR